MKFQSSFNVQEPEPLNKSFKTTLQGQDFLAMPGDSDPYIFSCDALPTDLRFLPPLTNGLLGWKVYNSIMHMGGLYNGEGGQCHRADVPCPLAVEVGMEEATKHTYTLDTHTGAECAEQVLAFRAAKTHRCPIFSLQAFLPTR